MCFCSFWENSCPLVQLQHSSSEALSPGLQRLYRVGTDSPSVRSLSVSLERKSLHPGLLCWHSSFCCLCSFASVWIKAEVSFVGQHIFEAHTPAIVQHAHLCRVLSGACSFFNNMKYLYKMVPKVKRLIN